MDFCLSFWRTGVKRTLKLLFKFHLYHKRAEMRVCIRWIILLRRLLGYSEDSSQICSNVVHKDVAPFGYCIRWMILSIRAGLVVLWWQNHFYSVHATFEWLYFTNIDFCNQIHENDCSHSIGLCRSVFFCQLYTIPERIIESHEYIVSRQSQEWVLMFEEKSRNFALQMEHQKKLWLKKPRVLLVVEVLGPRAWKHDRGERSRERSWMNQLSGYF